MKTNIKVIGIMITLLVILTVGKTFAYSDHNFFCGMSGTTPTANPFDIDEGFIALYASSVDYTDISMSVAEPSANISTGYVNVIMNHWMPFTVLNNHTTVIVNLKNNSWHTVNYLSGTMRY